MQEKLKYRPCETTRVTSPFGWRTHPITKERKMHNGEDLAPVIKVEEPIIATEDGTVVESSFNDVVGNRVIIKHGNGLETRSYHLSKRTVKTGDKVVAGEQIGNMGTTGDSTGEHLHFEVRINGVPQDPAPFIKDLDFVLGGEEEMTKEEIIAIVKEVLNGMNTKPSDWAKADWDAGTKEKIVDGTRPLGYATRQEVVAIIHNIKK